MKINIQEVFREQIFTFNCYFPGRPLLVGFAKRLFLANANNVLGIRKVNSVKFEQPIPKLSQRQCVARFPIGNICKKKSLTKTKSPSSKSSPSPMSLIIGKTGGSTCCKKKMSSREYEYDGNMAVSTLSILQSWCKQKM